MIACGADTAHVIEAVVDTAGALDQLISQPLIKQFLVVPCWFWSLIAYLIVAIGGWMLALYHFRYNAKQAYLQELARRRFDYAEKIMSSLYQCFEKAISIAQKNDSIGEKITDTKEADPAMSDTIMRKELRPEITQYYKAAEVGWPNIWLVNAFGSRVGHQIRSFKQSLEAVLQKPRENCESVQNAIKNRNSRIEWQRAGDVSEGLSKRFMELNEAIWNALKHPLKVKRH